MPRSSRPRNDDEDDDEFDEEELPDGVYLDDHEEESEDSDASSPTISCPYCGYQVYEGASYCVRCENFISKEDAPAEQKPVWIWICLLLALLAALFWVVPF